jgi:hypothetical protein
VTATTGTLHVQRLRHSLFSSRTPESLWLAGLIAADGCIARSGRTWSLGQSGDAGRARVEYVASLINYSNTISRHRPHGGQLAYAITVTSPAMAGDLAKYFQILPSKTLTYRWPGLAGQAAAAFLRGYIEGDGCVKVYPTPKGTPYLHLSYVATPEFVEAAREVTPPGGRIRKLPQCRNLTEVRYNGRHAWQFGSWLYSNDALYRSEKVATYQQHVASARPRWVSDGEKKSEGLRMMADGRRIAEVAAVLAVNWRTVYKWKELSRQASSATHATPGLPG